MPRKYLTREFCVFSLVLGIGGEGEHKKGGEEARVWNVRIGEQGEEKEGTGKSSLSQCSSEKKTKNPIKTVLNTSLSYFDAAWARAREMRLHPDSTIAIQKEVRITGGG